MISSFKAFWERNPALYCGLALVLGVLFAVQTPWALLPLPFLLHRKKFPSALVLFLLPTLLFYHFYSFPPVPSPAEGLFTIHSVHYSDKYGGGWNYQGNLKREGSRVKCRCFSKKFYPEKGVYHVQGVFKARQGSTTLLKITAPWECVKERYTLIPWRNWAKSYVKKYLHQHISQERAALFLAGMVTGELDDRVLKNEFAQLGLSHLMAISGLHFSLLALFFHCILRLFLPSKGESICLMCLLTGYLLFIGESPSIMRAWVAIMVYLTSRLVEKRPSPLNSLGVALIFSLLWDPLSATTLSFQLSFLATAGILCFLDPVNHLLSRWLPKKELKKVILKNAAWQHGYVLLSFFRESLSLTLAVHLALFPLLLSYFHSFSINSLFYNLFFPFLASLALLFFLVSLLLGPWAHVLNGYYCDWILKIPAAPPLYFTPFYCEAIPPWLLALLLTALLGFAIRCKIKKSADRLGIDDQPLFNHL